MSHHSQSFFSFQVKSSFCSIHRCPKSSNSPNVQNSLSHIQNVFLPFACTPYATWSRLIQSGWCSVQIRLFQADAGLYTDPVCQPLIYDMFMILRNWHRGECCFGLCCYLFRLIVYPTSGGKDLEIDNKQ